MEKEFKTNKKRFYFVLVLLWGLSLVVMLLAWLLSGCAPTADYATKEDLTAINGRVNNLGTQVQGLRTQVDGFSGWKSQVDQTLQTHTGQLAQLKTDLGSVQELAVKAAQSAEKALNATGASRGEISRLRRSVRQVAQFTGELARGQTVVYTVSGFKTGKSALPDEMPGALDGLITTIQGRTLTIQKIVGWADPSGNSKRNAAIAQARAETVKEYLAGKGFDLANTAIESGGETDLAGKPEENRAVQIFCTVP